MGDVKLEYSDVKNDDWHWLPVTDLSGSNFTWLDVFTGVQDLLLLIDFSASNFCFIVVSVSMMQVSLKFL